MKTVENIKRFIPFNNSTETLNWMSRNCDKCKYFKCRAKYVMKESIETGKITLNRARWMGLENEKLKPGCEKFTTVTNAKKIDPAMYEYKLEDHFNGYF